MQFVTLQEIKDMLNITFNSRDTVLTKYINLAESQVLQYIGADSKADLLERIAGTESPSEAIEDMMLASLEMAVRYMVEQQNRGNVVSIGSGLNDNLLVRLLMPYRAPEVSAGSSD
jgi:hypothetical protein